MRVTGTDYKLWRYERDVGTTEKGSVGIGVGKKMSCFEEIRFQIGSNSDILKEDNYALDFQ